MSYPRTTNRERIARMADTDTPPENEAPTRRPFADTLRDHARGRLHDEATDGLVELIEAATDTMRKGTLTITLTVTPRSEGKMIELDGKVVVKAPERAKPSTLFYVDKDNNLRRDDPDQTVLFSTLKAVDSTEAPLRHVGDDAR